jgi:hypothetical protein
VERSLGFYKLILFFPPLLATMWTKESAMPQLYPRINDIVRLKSILTIFINQGQGAMAHVVCGHDFLE